MESTASEGAQEGKGNCCHVNRSLLPIKGFYFVILAAVGSLLPFFSVYMKQLGLTPSEAGILYGSMPFIGFFARPIIGVITDKWQKHKIALIISSALTGVFYLLILAIPGRKQPSAVVMTNLECNPQDSYFRSCLTPSTSKEKENCPMTLMTFADYLLSNASGSGHAPSLECEVKCLLRSSMNEETFAMCFTNSSENFIQSCAGTQARDLPITFGLANISHVLSMDIEKDRIDAGNIHCRDYDLKAVVFQNQHFWQVLCNAPDVLDCEMMCQNRPQDLCESDKKEYDSTFGWLFLVYLLANVAFAPVFSLADAAAFKTLKDKPHKFGEQRLWGTVGFSLFAVTSTFVVYFMSSQGSAVDYTVLFYIFAALCFAAGVVAYFMDLEQVSCGNIFSNMLAVLNSVRVLAFLFVVLYFGMMTGTIEGFLFWYLSDLGATPLVFGLSLVINCVFEVPVFLGSGRILKHLGPVSCLYISIVGLMIRLLGYSLLGNPWIVLAIEPLHSITFSLMWASAATYASVLAPPGMQATIQGLVGGIHFGIGKGIGSLLTGVLYDHIGERWTYRAYAIATLGILAFYVLLNHFFFVAEVRKQSRAHVSGDKGGGINSEDGNQHLLLRFPPDTPEETAEANMTNGVVKA